MSRTKFSWRFGVTVIIIRVDYLVLDEADRMLDKGFENDIRNIISYTKQGPERQTMMCKWEDDTMHTQVLHPLQSQRHLAGSR